MKFFAAATTLTAFFASFTLASAQPAPSARTVAPRAVPAGQTGLQSNSGMAGNPGLGPMPGDNQALDSQSVSGATTSPNINPANSGVQSSSGASMGFAPPVNTVTPLPNSPIHFQGQVNPTQGSGLEGTNNSVNTSPFTPPQLGSGPALNSNGGSNGNPNGASSPQ